MFKMYYIATVSGLCIVDRGRHIDQWNRTNNSRNRPANMANQSLTEEPMLFRGGRTAFF